MVLPEPVEPSSAIAWPGSTRRLMSCSTGVPDSYSKLTASKTTSPRTSPAGRCVPSVSGSRSWLITSTTRLYDTSPVEVCTISRPRLRIGQMIQVSRPT